MSHNIHYNHLQPFLSFARANAIKNAFREDLNYKQIFGIYFWEQQVASSIYPIIQIIEISLRNSLNNVLKDRFSTSNITYWWDNPNIRYDGYDQHQNQGCRCLMCEFKKSINKAERQFKYNFKHIYGRDFIGNVSDNDIIAHSELYTWEKLLNKGFHSPCPIENDNYFYPKSFGKIFKGASNLNSQGQSLATLDMARTLVYKFRLLRNRLSHHDCLWTKSQIIGQAYEDRKEDVVKSIVKKIKDLEDLVKLISPELFKMINNWGLLKNAYRIASIETMNKYLDDEFYKFSSKLEQDAFFAVYNSYSEQCYSIASKSAKIIPRKI